MLEAAPARVTVFEVGPRDGLQNERRDPGLAAKIALVEALAASGLNAIEAGAFVSPKAVPAMAESAAVFEAAPRRAGLRYAALAPNLRGTEAALEAGADEIAFFAAASETFSQKNINASIDESFARFAPAAAQARRAGKRLRGYVSCALGCPFEGAISPGPVVAVVERFLALEVDEIALGDTIGAGEPLGAGSMLKAAIASAGAERLALHAHDTQGRALANVMVALELDVRTIDAAVAGLGGCPFAPGAAGNLASEDLVALLEAMGVATGVDLDALIRAGEAIATALGRPSGAKATIARRR